MTLAEFKYAVEAYSRKAKDQHRLLAWAVIRLLNVHLQKKDQFKGSIDEFISGKSRENTFRDRDDFRQHMRLKKQRALETERREAANGD